MRRGEEERGGGGGDCPFVLSTRIKVPFVTDCG